MKLLLDTNICIYIAKAHPKEVLARFKKLRPGDVGMSVITYGELYHGACKSRHRADAENILRELTAIILVAEISGEVGSHYGEIRAELEKAGQVIGNNDLWIAAHAVALGVPLITNNEREFKRIPGLIVQNWVRCSSEINEKSIPYTRR